MSEALGGPIREPGSRPSLRTIYVRGVALLLLLAGLARACLILGITPDGQSFATLTPAWRVGAATLMLVDLFAGVGLWVGAAWGPVMWAVGLAVEVSMYTLFPELFGTYPGRIAAHGLLFIGFLALTFFEWRRSLSE
jgi:Family of unknown function (DUF6163)